MRNPHSVSNVPAFLTATYALLHLAAVRAGLRSCTLPPPKWQPPKPQNRRSTAQLISLLRSELWGKALGLHLADFDAHPPPNTKCPKMPDSPAAAILYAHA